MRLNDRVLITGGCGYLGSALLRILTSDGADGPSSIRVLDHLGRGGRNVLADLGDSRSVEFIEGDILDPTTLEIALQGVGTVIHLAGFVTNPIAFDQGDVMEQNNHWATAHLIESCLAHEVPRVLFASSAAVYGPGEGLTEADPCQPFGAYAQSMLNAENAVMVAAERGLSPTVLRFGTFVGWAKNARYTTVGNKFAFQAGIGAPLVVHGQGDQVRPFVPVEEAARILLFAAKQPETVGRVLNAAEANLSVSDIVDFLGERRAIDIRYTDQDVLSRISISVDSTALQDLGWTPEQTTADALVDLAGRFDAVSELRLKAPHDQL